MSTMKTLTINGTTYKIAPIIPTASVTLLASAWVSDGVTYSQVVQVAGVTSRSKVDLQPTPAQLEEFHYKILAFVAENDSGVVTVYSIGDKPSGDHTIQITLTEVDTVGTIRGNTVGTTIPKTDLNQTDPDRADYLKGREKIVQSVNGVAPDENGNVVVEGGTGGTGEDGFSPIAAVTQTDTGAVVTITDKSGTTTATISNGKDGKDGAAGKDGTGVTILGSYASESALKAAHPTGSVGDAYLVTGNLYVWSATANNWENVGNIKGEKGDPGTNGTNGVGIASIHQTSTSTADDGNNVITVTLTDGTSETFVVQNGSKGSAGTNGKDGTSISVQSVSESPADGGSNTITFTDGKKITIKNGSKGSTGDKGDTGAAGYTPVRGTDYWTEADIATIKSYVDEAILGGAW